MKYTLPKLPYAYNALEPYIDEQTMIIHHTKHHQAYIDKLNTVLEKHPEIAETPLENLLLDIDTAPEDIRAAVRNHGGGHYNHSLFWETFGPKSKTRDAPSGELAEAIDKTFGDFNSFKEKFTSVAVGQFGSGWAWLAMSPVEGLRIYSLSNQDSPLSKGEAPLLGLDVWEHAYYLKYQNKRADYITAFWNVLNWAKVEQKYQNTLG